MAPPIFTRADSPSKAGKGGGERGSGMAALSSLALIAFEWRFCVWRCWSVAQSAPVSLSSLHPLHLFQDGARGRGEIPHSVRPRESSLPSVLYLRRTRQEFRRGQRRARAPRRQRRLRAPAAAAPGVRRGFLRVPCCGIERRRRLQWRLSRQPRPSRETYSPACTPTSSDFQMLRN